MIIEGLKGRGLAITGAAGVLGRAVARIAIASGASVSYLDIRPCPDPFVREKARFVCAPLSDRQALTELVEGADAVIHLAAKMPQARLSPDQFWAVNVGATLELARSAARAGLRRFVFASTTEIYGPQKCLRPITEEAEKLFTGPYSRNKYEVEQRLLPGDLIETVALRMPMVFGPGFYHEKAIIATFWLLRLGLPLPVTAPDCLVSFVSARDAAQGILLAAVKDGAAGEAFNLAAPDTPTMLEFFLRLKRAAGSRSKPFVVPESLVQRATRYASESMASGRDKILFGTPAELVPFIGTGGAYAIDKARERLGYSPIDTTVDAWLTAYRWYFAVDRKERMRTTFLYRV
jgi:nucleoside-diphosphate-sugar epimerase